jgi:hypothetical protein
VKWTLKEKYKGSMKRSWLFEKINMINKSLAKLTKGKRKKIKINKVRDKKGLL